MILTSTFDSVDFTAMACGKVYCDIRVPVSGTRVYMNVLYAFLADAYTTEDLVFRWRTDADPVEMNGNISLPEYTITNVSYLVCSKNFSSTG